ncbi:hypothetical protein LOK49_Contig504G00001 [Camellia lanceoleosa]|nr:hypothetical protein LOK49_Contig504G00001 [Camellia lanceoleosa]
MEEVSNNKKRVRNDSYESDSDSPEVKRLRDDLFCNLDDSDLCTTSPDLDSFMKSFEVEITASPPVTVVDLTSDSGESQPDLGFLLEASDDELGLPPSNTTPSDEEVVELVRVSSDSSTEFSEMWRFDDQILSYDSFEFGIAGEEESYNRDENGGYVALDGLFDYSDLSFGLADSSVALFRPETMPAAQ